MAVLTKKQAKIAACILQAQLIWKSEYPLAIEGVSDVELEKIAGETSWIVEKILGKIPSEYMSLTPEQIIEKVKKQYK